MDGASKVIAMPVTTLVATSIANVSLGRAMGLRVTGSTTIASTPCVIYLHDGQRVRHVIFIPDGPERIVCRDSREMKLGGL